MIANFLKMIAPVAIVALAVSGPAIAKDKQPKAENGGATVAQAQPAGATTGASETAGSQAPAAGVEKSAGNADNKVIEMNIPPKGKESSEGKTQKAEKDQKSSKTQKTAKAKKDSDKQKDPKKDKKKVNG